MLDKLVELLVVQKEFGRPNPQAPGQSGLAELTLDHAGETATIQSSAVSEHAAGGNAQARRSSALALQPEGGDVGIGTLNPDARLHVASGGGFHAPQLCLEQTTKNNFARLRLNGARKAADGGETAQSQADPDKYWDIAAGGRTNVMNFYSKALADSGGGNGNALTLTGEGKVGVGVESPGSALHVNGKATVDLLEINGGGDIAGPFPAGDGPKIEPGTVMAIDSKRPGALKMSDAPYDRRVAGIAAGAGGLTPGLVLRPGSAPEGGIELALAGRAYCKAEADSAPIEPGDLLTTSTVPGHAMKASRPDCHGAVIGKAMSGLKRGRGLVLVLVNLH
jgi:hypothetical protein